MSTDYRLKSTGIPNTRGGSEGDSKVAPFSINGLQRPRWNVVDLIDIFGRSRATTYLFSDVDMSWSEALRKDMSSESERVTITAILLKAVSIAQVHHPASRTFYIPGGKTVTFNETVAGFTVERWLNGQPAVFFGEISEPCQKSIQEISHILHSYSASELEEIPKLKQQVDFLSIPKMLRRLLFHLASLFPLIRLSCMKATFGLSSLGALGVNSVCGPTVCTAVFGVGNVEDRAVVKDGQIQIRPTLTLSLSFDQRAMTGIEAAEFFREVRELLEGKLAAYI
jgi:hypothetical protein